MELEIFWAVQDLTHNMDGRFVVPIEGEGSTIVISHMIYRALD